MSAPLSARRKADRAKIAATFRAVAEKFGAGVEERQEPRNVGYSGAGVRLNIAWAGVGAMIDVDDLHGGDFALIHWFNTAYPARHFSSAFNVAVGDLSHPRPHHKATSSGTWDMLAARLQAGLRHADKGTAFID